MLELPLVRREGPAAMAPGGRNQGVSLLRSPLPLPALHCFRWSWAVSRGTNTWLPEVNRSKGPPRKADSSRYSLFLLNHRGIRHFLHSWLYAYYLPAYTVLLDGGGGLC